MVICPFAPYGLAHGPKLVKSSSTGVQTCGTRISETTGWIYPIQSSMELSRSVDVQHQGHMTLTLDFQGQILKKAASQEQEGRLTWKQKGCESIGSWIHIVTLNFDLTHVLDLEISRSNFVEAVSQECEGRLTWNERDMSR